MDPIQGILAILDRGNTTGTNKFGLLLSLIDLAPYVGADRRIQYRDIVLKLIEIHWSHSVPYSGAGTLRQLSSPNKENTTVIQEIGKLRQEIAPSCQFEQALKTIDSSKWEKAIAKITTDTRRNALRKLQTINRAESSFLYDIDKTSASITMHENALAALIQFGPVIREVVEFKFVHCVVKCNKPILGDTVDGKVHRHLFAHNRQMPSSLVRKQLWELQGQRCLYTGEVLDDPTLKSDRVAIDHVIPWSISKLSQIENFVVTSKKINSSKSNLLISPKLLKTWSEYVLQNRFQLSEISQSSNWPSDLKQVCDIALALYTHKPGSTLVWNFQMGFEPLGEDGQIEAIKCLEELKQLL